jgi:hypothetical protein
VNYVSLKTRLRHTLRSLAYACVVTLEVCWEAAQAIFRIGLHAMLIRGCGYEVFEHVFPERWVEVHYLGWGLSVGGHLELSSVKISNTHSSKLKDFVVACEAIGNSGTTIQTVRAKPVYESLDPHAELTIPGLDIGPVSDQTSKIRCWVSGARLY